ncbi:two component transcriptional regulator, LytTR family [Lishizhenia tianjinensis]|uniref:Two component transcriptional regulator, LytTR family n=1 Tax=Lishizhenia tianjinensis TaxID=477690 RepID=A0A1I7BFD8_9FLAO|nr:LytTR family DNA-binding domain-containing protein [Lishizhenia tianjinensis]SFT85832.1 two component transcriptional regulator, LytTR family [Lishizhenia tianjinensis]
MKAVIIDDMEAARTALKADLESYCPDIEIIGEAQGVVSGAKLIKEVSPELVFLDVQMPDGSGFDLLEILPQLDFDVIFTTASDAYALKAFKVSAVDYLMKPIDPDDLMEAVKRAKDQNNSSERLSLLKENMQGSKKIALNTLEKIQIVNIEDIIRCESSVNYTTFYFMDGTKLLVTKTLKEFDKMLSEYNFFRVHQSHLINTEFIKEFLKTNGELVMKDGTKVPVSTRKKAQVMEMLNNL